MPRYVVLLRAIGPLTHKVMSMADLVRGCEAAGLHGARTYIQTGNILLTSDWPAERVQAAVAGVVAGFGLDNAVVVRTVDELAAVVAAAPFPDAAADHPSHLAICFLASEPAPERWARVEAHPGPERTKRVEAELAVDYPVGIGTSKFAPGVIERRLGVVATARNWNTVLKLLELGQRP